MSGEFRRYLFPRDHPRVAEVRGLDPYAYGELARTPATFTGGLVEGWMPLYRSDFRGVTEDATLRDGLYDLTRRSRASRCRWRRWSPQPRTCSPSWTTSGAPA